jgi:IS30 family transposase
VRQRELPLTAEEKRVIRNLDARGLTSGKIAVRLMLHKRQVNYELKHGSRTDRGEER